MIIGLDAVRTAAAVYVAAGHVVATVLPSALTLPFRFGQEAVILFFLLSGFVIFANERDRFAPVWPYLVRRVVRIYPPLLAAMLVSSIVAALDGLFDQRFSWISLFGTLLGLQDAASLKPGVIVDPFMKNDPLWSLSYEFAFYALFPAVMALWVRRPLAVRHAIGMAAVASYLLYAVFPNHWSLVLAYFLVWWTGAMCAYFHQSGRPLLQNIGLELGWLVLLCAAAAGVAILGPSQRGVGFYPVLPLRHFAAALGIVLLGISPFARWLFRRLLPVARPAAFLSSISYGIYVLHYPLLVQSSIAHGVLGFAFSCAILVALSWLVDRRATIYFRQRRRARRHPHTAATVRGSA